MKHQASENWWRAFSSTGSICATCLCGVTMFAPDSGMDFEPGELENLEAMVKEKPDKYIALRGQSSVSVSDTGHLWGCTCGWPERFENLLKNYRGQVLEYYRMELIDHRKETEAFDAALKDATAEH